MVGNGPHHHGPCRYTYVAQPAPYTKGDLLEVWAAGPPTMRHHRLPTRGTRDDEHHSRLTGPRHRAHQFSQTHAAGQCTGWWRCRVSHMQGQSSHRPFADF